MTKRILVADDEPLIRKALADYLTSCGHEVVPAVDGAEALRLALAEPFDLVLLDLRMPRMHGLEVIASLSTERPRLPVVVVSGAMVLDDAVEALRRGAWDYVSKPIYDLNEIGVVLDRVWDRAHLVAERDHYQHELERVNRSLQAEVARQTENLRAQNAYLKAMNRVAQAISQALELDTMLARVVEAVIDAVSVEAAFVLLLNPATDCLYLAALQGLSQGALPFPQPLALGEGVLGAAAQEGRVRTGTAEANVSTSEVVPQGFASYAFIPLRSMAGLRGQESEQRSGQSILGILGVYGRRHAGLDLRALRLLNTVGNQLGIAITRAHYAADLTRANVELEMANADLRRLDALREQFIQNVAHELRTPLALVHGYVDLLAEGGLSKAEQARALEVAKARVSALVELVASITTLQDLSTEPLAVTEISMSQLLETACKLAMQRAMAAQVSVEWQDGGEIPRFAGDFSRLVQALYQLLDNSCKFSAAGTTVTVTPGLSVDRNFVTIEVRDQGYGIPPHEHERIFERFYQIDGSATRRYGGTGLGLALVKEIAEVHGGWVSVDSEVGVGSAFTIALPRAGVTRPLSQGGDNC